MKQEQQHSLDQCFHKEEHENIMKLNPIPDDKLRKMVELYKFGCDLCDGYNRDCGWYVPRDIRHLLGDV